MVKGEAAEQVDKYVREAGGVTAALTDSIN